MSPPVPPPLEPASDEDLVAFMRWLHKRSRRPAPSLRFDDPARSELVPPEFRDKLRAITLRIVMDVMKRPAPPALSTPAGRPPGPRPKRSKPRRTKKPARKPTARKSAAKRRRRRAG